MAKLRRFATIIDFDERLRVATQAVDLLDQICGRNPDVFNYQIARSRASGRYVAILDRNATLAKDESMAFVLRNDATDEANRATQLFGTLRDQFDGAFVDRLPASYQVQLAEVIAKMELAAAVELFRDAINANDDFVAKARAELGLAAFADEHV